MKGIIRIGSGHEENDRGRQGSEARRRDHAFAERLYGGPPCGERSRPRRDNQRLYAAAGDGTGLSRLLRGPLRQ